MGWILARIPPLLLDVTVSADDYHMKMMHATFQNC